ncbi:MAG: CDP-glycerol glycerophosphotransferase family protein [Dehalococcoidales bacterium]|jgi:CDP-glycerol glycerophosphotransferase (TagB/SpsB family)|nr:CDP-glycerol glycerophosphotransferase family protein [Dehalococcoidales bacterium]
MKKVMFYSVPDMTDNTWYLYEKLRDKVECVWLVHDKKAFEGRMPPCSIVDPGSCAGEDAGLVSQLSMTVLSHTVYAEAFRRYNPGHRILYLGHGAVGKGVKADAVGKDMWGFDNILTLGGELSTRHVNTIFGGGRERCLELGYPRNDILFRHAGIRQGGTVKILWMPTFRQSWKKSLNQKYIRTETGLSFPGTWEDMKRIDDRAGECGVEIHLKLHRLQLDLPVFRRVEQELSNIRMVKQDRGDFYRKAVEYHALLTDYSSVYADWMLIDRPVGFVLNDLDEYAQSRGPFTYDFKQYAPGHHIYGMNDMGKFIGEIAAGTDSMKPERDRLFFDIHGFRDGNSSERVAQWVMEHI